MKLITTLLLLVFVAVNPFAQPCEPEVIDLNFHLKSPAILKGPANTYQIVGSKSNDTIYYYKVDRSGQILESYSFADSNSVELIDAISTQDDHILLLVNRKPGSAGSIVSSLIKIDQSGNKIWSIDDSEMFLKCITVGPDQSYYLGGYKHVIFSQATSSMLRKVSNTGNPGPKVNFVNIPINPDSRNGEFELGNEVTGISYTNDQRLYFTIAGKAGYSSSGIAGSNFLVKTDTLFSSFQITTLNSEGYAISPYTFIQATSANGLMVALCPPPGAPIDGSTNLATIDYLDAQHNLIQSKEIYHCGFKMHAFMQDEDSTYLINGDGRFFRYNLNHELLSYSSFYGLKSISSQQFQSKIIKNSQDEFTFLSIETEKLYLVHYSYFGNDCLTKIKGTVFYDQNENCVYDSLEKPFRLLNYYPLSCNRIISDSNGLFTKVAEYGTNILFTKPDLASPSNYHSTCLKLEKDTVIVRYPDTCFMHNIPIHKKDKCFSYTIYTGNSSPYFEGGLFYTLVRIKNGADSVIRNCKIFLIRDSNLMIVSANYPYTISGDTLIFTIDSIPSDQLVELLTSDEMECPVPKSNSLCQRVLVQIRNPCTDSLHLWQQNICGSRFNDETIQANLSFGPRRPCLTFTNTLRISNLGARDQTDVRIEIEKTDNLINLSSSYHYQLINGKLVFLINQLAIKEKLEIIMVDSVSCDAKLRDTSCISYKIEYLHCDSSVHTINAKACRPLSNSYDPNYIVSKLTNNVKCFPTNSKTIIPTYTIRFQNLGNDTAYKVVIHDTLSPTQFNISTIKPLSASHKYTWSILHDSILVVTYDNINLLHAEASYYSFGHFEYSVTTFIKEENKLPSASIKNRAAIYFDFNEAVITEFDEIYPCIINSSEDVTKKSTKAKNYILYPNPAQNQFTISTLNASFNIVQVNILSSTGQIMKHLKQNETQGPIMIEDLSSGWYLVEILSDQSRDIIPLIIQK